MMTIQVNTDNNLTVHKGFGSRLQEQLTDALSRFSKNITRIEVHLSDENGAKDGFNDKKCLLEARVEHRKPFIVTENAATYELAVSGATDKLKHMLDGIFGKLQNY